MKGLVRLVVRRTIRGWEDIRHQEVRSRYGVLEGWIGIAVNFLLFLLKGVLGILTGSVALIADAFHTLSDVSTSAVVVVSFRLSKKPADAAHPFGHGRMEAVGALVVAVLLLVVGIEVFKGGFDRILHPKAFEASWLVVGLIALTIVVKEGLARFSRELGRMVESTALEADFWHHRTDAISSILVIFAFLGQRFGLSYLDGVVGVLVSVLIAYTGWKVARKGIDDLLGKQPSDAFVREVKDAVREFPEVLDVHDLIVHEYGQRTVMSFHVVVSDALSLREGHALADEVGKVINKKFRTHATVHLDPVDIHDPELREIQESLEAFLSRWEGLVSFHDLRVVDGDEGKVVALDLVVDPDVKDEEIDGVKEELGKALRRRFPGVEGVRFEVEPRYAR